MYNCQEPETDEAAIAEAAMPAFRLSGGSLYLLQQLVNTSFRVEHAHRNWYLRVYNLHRRSGIEIQSELLWLESLAEANIAVPTPRRTVENRLLWHSPRGSDRAAHWVSVTAWLPGRIIPGDERSSRHYKAVGRLLAEVHEHASRWHIPADFARPSCDADGVYSKLDELTLYKPELHETQLWIELATARDALLVAESTIGRTRNRFGLVHGDPSFGNILFKDEKPLLIDFDDCGYGFYVSDLAVVLAGAWGKAGYEQNRTALIEGYQAVRPLAQAELVALPLMMAARAASLILWAVETSRNSWVTGQWQRLQEYLAIR